MEKDDRGAHCMPENILSPGVDTAESERERKREQEGHTDRNK